MATGTALDVNLEGLLASLDLDGRYFIVDIGANLTNKKFARDLSAVVQRAKDSGLCSRQN